MIRPAEVADLTRVGRLADEFYSASQFLKAFDIDRFTALWTPLIENGIGVIYLLEAEDGTLQGLLGALAYPEIYSGAMVASEMFWFVHQAHRGQGMQLYRAYEQWARDKQCSEIRVVHLLDSMPERLSIVYKRLGYTPAEIHYCKNLSK